MNEPSGISGQLDSMRAALEWYAGLAKRMRAATLHTDNQVALHILKELALDGGKRATEAIATGAKV